MARIIPKELNSDFLKIYKVETFNECAPSMLTIKVWDLYGTSPKAEEEISAEGKYIAAVVYCEACDKSIELYRNHLDS